MAAAIVARHPSPSSYIGRHPGPVVNRPISTSTSTPQPPTSTSRRRPDDFYGNENIAKMCARYINDLFHCPDHQPLSSSGHAPPDLPRFIAYALHRTRLAPSVTFAALYLLQRLKTRFIAARGSSGHRLFISAFMIASKVICDDTYSNKSWCIVGQGMFVLREINQMEREMCSYLEWQLNVEPAALVEFESMVKLHVKQPSQGPPKALLPAPPSGPFAHPKPPVNNVETTIPSFGPGAPPSPPSATSTVPSERSSRRSSAESYPAPNDHPHLPTPPALLSDVSSPANSMSPATPVDTSRSNAKIVSSAGSNTMQIPGDNVSPPYHHHVHTRKSSSPIPAHQKHQHVDMKRPSPKKSSSAHQHSGSAKSNTVYAYARPCVW
jgi:hypothetical protein